ncbi:type II secretion system secretin GspD [Alkalilimnicola sp. S0819]|uniref:type II secretion system secretin GspD n=1 Tax=Alkalilimnicola sp. S0819 TaxID=2613922 RepID=UPI0018698B5E|nr:type II secretion system secretin GspD [Alkalilimnicola sp. S0819]
MRPRRASATLAALLTGALLLGGIGTLHAQNDQQAAPREEITLNLKDADLSALISTVSEITGENFIVDPRVKARITVVSKRPMNADELYEVFQSILQVHGFSAIRSGEVTKIVPDVNAKQLGPEPGEAPGAGDQVVTRIISVENIPVAQLIPILRPLVPQQGHLAAYPPTNVLIISDRAANVERMRELISRIDRASDDEIEVVPLKHASALEMVGIIEGLEQSGAPGAEGPPSAQLKLAADERSNSILISGDRASRARMRALIAQLDQPLDQEGGTRVLYLKYAKAEDLVPVLTGVSENIEQTRQQAEGGNQQGRAQAGERVNIQAHEATNSLVVSGPPSILQSLETVVKQLDVRRAQVLIEAAIAEIAFNQGREFGVQWGATDDSGDYGGVGTNFSSSDAGGSSFGSILSAVLAGGDLSNVSIGSGMTALVGDISGSVRWAALIRALSTSNDTNILSTPSILTLDNQEAEIRVAENIPILTGRFESESGVGNPFQTIEREDVGLILKVKPQINEGDSLMLEIEQESSTVGQETEAGFRTNKRTIKTSVLVDDGSLVVLGGLIDEQVDEREQRVPVLGGVPVLGELFRYRDASKGKRNLTVFLRPQIMRGERAMDYYTGRKYNQMREEQLRQRERGIRLMPDQDPPLLPDYETTRLPIPFGQSE